MVPITWAGSMRKGEAVSLPFVGSKALHLPAEMQSVSGWGGGERPSCLPTVLWHCQPGAAWQWTPCPTLRFKRHDPNPA